MEVVFVDGDFVGRDQAKISVFDRGFLFGEAAYEVVCVVNSELIELQAHLNRLIHSLSELEIDVHARVRELSLIARDLVSRNGLAEGIFYLQISRGSGARQFVDNVAGPPTVMAMVQEKPILDTAASRDGIKVIAVEDMRWGRCDIKTVQLVYQTMAKRKAASVGAQDAWLYRDAYVTEGASSNAFIVEQGGAVVTAGLDRNILNGITRRGIIECADELGLRLEQRPFTLAEVASAREAFATSTSDLVMPVIQVDDQVIGSGRPGPIARALRKAYLDRFVPSPQNRLRAETSSPVVGISR